MTPTVHEHIDCKGMKCPMPIVQLSKAMRKLTPGQTLSVEADDPAFKADLEAWIKKLDYILVEFEDGKVARAVVEKTKTGEAQTPEQQRHRCSSLDNPALINLIEELITKEVAAKYDSLEKRIEQSLAQAGGSKQPVNANRATIVVFSGDMDKLMAAFIIANGAAAMEMEVSMFFTFWGLISLKKNTLYKGKPFTEKLMTAMLPKGPGEVGTSKMNMLGLGPAFFKMIMKKRNVENLPGLITQAREMKVRLVACQMTMDLLGLKREEFLDDLEYGGVATFLSDAGDSRITLFI